MLAREPIGNISREATAATGNILEDFARMSCSVKASASSFACMAASRAAANACQSPSPVNGRRPFATMIGCAPPNSSPVSVTFVCTSLDPMAKLGKGRAENTPYRHAIRH